MKHALGNPRARIKPRDAKLPANQAGLEVVIGRRFLFEYPEQGHQFYRNTFFLRFFIRWFGHVIRMTAVVRSTKGAEFAGSGKFRPLSFFRVLGKHKH